MSSFSENMSSINSSPSVVSCVLLAPSGVCATPVVLFWFSSSSFQLLSTSLPVLPTPSTLLSSAFIGSLFPSSITKLLPSLESRLTLELFKDILNFGSNKSANKDRITEECLKTKDWKIVTSSEITCVRVTNVTGPGAHRSEHLLSTCYMRYDLKFIMRCSNYMINRIWCLK